MKMQKGYAEFWALAGVSVVLMAGLLLIDYMVSKYRCDNRAVLMKLEPRYSMMLGCMVKIEDRYVPMNYIRINQNGDVVIVPDDEE